MVGETDAEAVFDSIGQGSFGAALALSLNIGCTIFDTTKADKKGRYIEDKVERDYLRRLNLQDMDRTWLRVRSRIKVRIKANTSSDVLQTL